MFIRNLLILAMLFLFVISSVHIQASSLSNETICEIGARNAEMTMHLRQYGLSKAETIEILEEAKKGHFEIDQLGVVEMFFTIMFDAIDLAYSIPIYETKQQKEKAIFDFYLLNLEICQESY